MEDNLIVWWGAIPTVILIVQLVRGWMKEAKDSTGVDNEQNLKIAELQGEINANKKDISNIYKLIGSNDSRVATEMAKLERKLDKITEMLLQLVKP